MKENLKETGLLIVLTIVILLGMYLVENYDSWQRVLGWFIVLFTVCAGAFRDGYNEGKKTNNNKELENEEEK